MGLAQSCTGAASACTGAADSTIGTACSTDVVVDLADVGSCVDFSAAAKSTG